MKSGWAGRLLQANENDRGSDLRGVCSPGGRSLDSEPLMFQFHELEQV